MRTPRRTVGRYCRSFGSTLPGNQLQPEESAVQGNRDLVHDLHASRLLYYAVVQNRDLIMLSRCANDRCGKPFLKLREGKLFLVETGQVTKPGTSVPPFVRARKQQRAVEHYWLCDGCAAHWTLVYDRERGIALAPLRRPASAAPTAANSQTGVA